MFAFGVAVDHYLVSDLVLMVDAACVSSFTVLNDELLLAFFDVLPTGLERRVEDGITSKDELSRRCPVCSVDYRAHCVACSSKNS